MTPIEFCNYVAQQTDLDRLQWGKADGYYRTHLEGVLLEVSVRRSNYMKVYNYYMYHHELGEAFTLLLVSIESNLERQALRSEEQGKKFIENFIGKTG